MGRLERPNSPRLRFGFRDQPFPALFMMGDGHVSTGYMKLIATVTASLEDEEDPPAPTALGARPAWCTRTPRPETVRMSP